MWTLVGAHIASQYVPLLAEAGVLPCTQFALHASSNVANLIRGLHDYVWFRFLRCKRVCLVVDDVRHAYGFVVYDTLRCLLRVAGFPQVVLDLLLLATTKATVHMDGSGGVALTVRCGARLPGVSNGVLRSGRSARPPCTPSRASMLGTRRTFQPARVYV